MYVPALDGFPPHTAGEANYEHPDRIQMPGYFGPYQDNFSSISIYISLLALVYDPMLFERYSANGLLLLFNAQDYVDPKGSDYFVELKLLSREMAMLAYSFEEICSRSIDKVPTLEEFLTQNHIGTSRNIAPIREAGKYFFLSHATRDDQLTDQIADLLREAGYRTFVDHRDIKVGMMDWDTEVETALDTCDAMVLVATQSSMASQNVKVEWNYYLEEEKPIVLVMGDDCRRPFRLRLLQYVDFHTLGFSEASAKLLAGLEVMFH